MTWPKKPLGEVATLQRGFDLPADRRDDGPYPVISSGGVTGRHSVPMVNGPGVVTGRYGSIGEVYFVTGDFWPLNTTLWVKNFHNNDRKFIYHLLKSFDFGKFSDKTGVPGVNRNDLHKVHVSHPPVWVQQQIVATLDLWDTAIEQTKRLIAEKRLRRKGLMQQLLTGKRRLPGFAGEWREHEIGKLFQEVNRPVEWNDEELYDLISVRRRSGGLFHRESLYGRQILTKNLKTARTGDFLISKMQVLHGATGLVTSEFDGMKISGSYISLVPRKPELISTDFFSYFSQLPSFYHLTFLASFGVHIEKMTFNIKWFMHSKISIPPKTEEQEAIVTFLKSADRELDLLQAKAETLREQKKGLMQQLLTGKIRVRPGVSE